MQAIYANASTTFRQPRHLYTVVRSIDDLEWYSAKTEGLGNMYEGLLEKNAEEIKSGAGRYSTARPRHLAFSDFNTMWRSADLGATADVAVYASARAQQRGGVTTRWYFERGTLSLLGDEGFRVSGSRAF